MENRKVFTCEVCKKNFRVKCIYDVHIKVSHKTVEEEPQKNKVSSGKDGISNISDKNNASNNSGNNDTLNVSAKNDTSNIRGLDMVAEGSLNGQSILGSDDEMEVEVIDKSDTSKAQKDNSISSKDDTSISEKEMTDDTSEPEIVENFVEVNMNSGDQKKQPAKKRGRPAKSKKASVTISDKDDTQNSNDKNETVVEENFVEVVMDQEKQPPKKKTKASKQIVGQEIYDKDDNSNSSPQIVSELSNANSDKDDTSNFSPKIVSVFQVSENDFETTGDIIGDILKDILGEIVQKSSKNGKRKYTKQNNYYWNKRSKKTSEEEIIDLDEDEGTDSLNKQLDKVIDKAQGEKNGDEDFDPSSLLEVQLSEENPTSSQGEDQIEVDLTEEIEVYLGEEKEKDKDGKEGNSKVVEVANLVEISDENSNSGGNKENEIVDNGEGPTPCVKCGQVLPNTTKWAEHCRKIHGLNACSFCNFYLEIGQNPYDLANHVNKNHGGCCEKCFTCFRNKTDYENHVKRCEKGGASKAGKDDSKKFRCKICGRDFIIKEAADRHLKRCQKSSKEDAATGQGLRSTEGQPQLTVNNNDASNLLSKPGGPVIRKIMLSKPLNRVAPMPRSVAPQREENAEATTEGPRSETLEAAKKVDPKISITPLAKPRDLNQAKTLCSACSNEECICVEIV